MRLSDGTGHPMGALHHSPRERIPSLDGLRAVAILLVVVYHFANTQKAPLWHGRTWTMIGGAGVDVFFAISGFLITTLLLRERGRTGSVSLRGFYARRCVRILPALFAYLAVMALFDRLGWIQVPLRDWVAALTYTVNFVPGVSLPLAHIWSLSVEEHFYLIWPILFIVAGARQSAWIAGACLLLEPVIRHLSFRFAAGYIDIDFATFTRLDAIAGGCLLAQLAESSRARRLLRLVEAKPLLSVAIALAVVVCSIVVLSRSGKYTITLKPTVHALAICVVLWSAVRCPNTVVGRLLNFAPLAWIGRLSYSLYLWQEVFLDRTNGGRWMCQFPQNLILAFGAAIASYYLIEQPILAWRRRPREAATVHDVVPAAEPRLLAA
jgi:peptidoglycan/LPS O-acetylase OafA/YrhL